jgi:hypothetical protein
MRDTDSAFIEGIYLMVKILLINGVNIDGATGAAARLRPPSPSTTQNLGAP